MTAAGASVTTWKNVPAGVPNPGTAPHSVLLALAPMFVAATENALTPPDPPRCTMPSSDGVVATAITSVVAPVHAKNDSVFTPGMFATGAVFAQSNVNDTVVPIGAEGVNAIRKL